MSANDDLKQKIKQLEQAIAQQKQSSHTGPRRPHPYNKFHPRGTVRPVSRNMKLVVQNKPNEQQSSSSNAVQSGYVSVGNRLVRMGVNPSRPPSPIVRPSRSMKLINKSSNNSSSARSQSVRPPRKKYNSVVVVDGEEFIRAGRGNKLIRSAPLASQRYQQPKAVTVAGERFVRTRSGNLVRLDALKAHRSKLMRPSKRRQRRICTKFLRGICENTAESCKFSHTPCEENTPKCYHYQSDNCTNPNCLYIHAKENQKAPICRPFVYNGWCNKGKKCLHRHVWECPDFVEKGKCTNPKCRLPHPDRPSQVGEQGSVQRPDFTDMFNEEKNKDQGDVDEPSENNDGGGGNISSSNDEISDDEAEELLKWYDDNYVENA